MPQLQFDLILSSIFITWALYYLYIALITVGLLPLLLITSTFSTAFSNKVEIVHRPHKATKYKQSYIGLTKLSKAVRNLNLISQFTQQKFV